MTACIISNGNIRKDLNMNHLSNELLAIKQALIKQLKTKYPSYVKLYPHSPIFKAMAINDYVSVNGQSPVAVVVTESVVEQLDLYRQGAFDFERSVFVTAMLCGVYSFSMHALVESYFDEKSNSHIISSPCGDFSLRFLTRYELQSLG